MLKLITCSYVVSYLNDVLENLEINHHFCTLIKSGIVYNMLFLKIPLYMVIN